MQVELVMQDLKIKHLRLKKHVGRILILKI